MPRAKGRPPAPPRLPIKYPQLWGIWTNEDRRNAVIRQRGWPEDATDEDKQAYADLIVPELNKLHEQLDVMSDDERRKLVGDHLHKLRSAVKRKRAAEDHAQRMTAERNVEFMHLMMLGEVQAQMAREAGVTPKIVSDAIGTTVDPHGPSGRSQRDGQ